MENPCKIVFFGDSITLGYTPFFEKKFRENYPEIKLTVVNAGVVGETSRDGLLRVDGLVAQSPEIAVIGFGMNDWRKGVDKKEYKKNLIIMLEKFESIGTRVIINTVNPSYNFEKLKYNYEVNKYSEIVRNIAYEKKIKIADINAAWKRELKRPQKGLRDELHPNSVGYEIMINCLVHIVPRRNTTILWQYNGHHAKCNYRCPYCYYIRLHSPDDRFFGTIEQWRDNFKKEFGNQHLVFYLAFGEPTYGEKFPEILEMISSEPNWELRITSNISYNLDKIVTSKAAREGRLNINASYHPCMIKREEFTKKILFLRENGIEVPIVYVAYPPYLSHFEEDIKYFSNLGFVVHVRRFIGIYKGKKYPDSYSEDEMHIIASYCDTGTIKYMLNQKINKRWLTYSGLHFFVIDNVGNVGYDVDAFQPYTKERCIFGNINSGNFRPNLEPMPYPGVMEGTVDGVANLLVANYKELEGNNVLSFAKQGNVYKDVDGRVVYGNMDKDFTCFKIREEYGFKPRNLKEYLLSSSFNRQNYFKEKIVLFGKKNLNSGTKKVIKKIIKKGV